MSTQILPAMSRIVDGNKKIFIYICFALIKKLLILKFDLSFFHKMSQVLNNHNLIGYILKYLDIVCDRYAFNLTNKRINKVVTKICKKSNINLKCCCAIQSDSYEYKHIAGKTGCYRYMLNDYYNTCKIAAYFIRWAEYGQESAWFKIVKEFQLPLNHRKKILAKAIEGNNRAIIDYCCKNYAPEYFFSIDLQMLHNAVRNNDLKTAKFLVRNDKSSVISPINPYAIKRNCNIELFAFLLENKYVEIDQDLAEYFLAIHHFDLFKFTIELNVEYWHNHIYNIYKDAFYSNYDDKNLNIIKYLDSKFNPEMQNEILYRIINYNQPKTLLYVESLHNLSQFNLDPNRIEYYDIASVEKMQIMIQLQKKYGIINGEYFRSAIVKAIIYRDHDMFNLLIHNYQISDPNFCKLMIKKAITSANKYALSFLCEYKYEVHCHEMYSAIAMGKLHFIDYVLARRNIKLDIHQCNEYMFRQAAYYGQLHIVKYLAARGVDIHRNRAYAFRYAVKNGHLDVVKYLSKLSVKINKPIHLKTVKKALSVAYDKDHYDIAHYIENNFNVIY